MRVYDEMPTVKEMAPSDDERGGLAKGSDDCQTKGLGYIPICCVLGRCVLTPCFLYCVIVCVLGFRCVL